MVSMKEESKINDYLMEQVNAFGREILECDEYKALLQCDEVLDKDQEAKDLLRQFRLKQQELQLKGFDRKTLDELNALEMQLKKNETLANLESSQKAVAAIFRSSNGIISEKIGQEFAQRRGGCF